MLMNEMNEAYCLGTPFTTVLVLLPVGLFS